MASDNVEARKISPAVKLNFALLIVLFVALLNAPSFLLANIFIAKNSVPLTTLAVIITLAAYIKITNIAKNRALKVIYKITQIKLQTLDSKNLISSICKKLQKGFKGKFAIILANQYNAASLDNPALSRFYDTKIKLSSSNSHRSIKILSGKVLYFYPLTISGENLGILLVEINIFDDFIFSFRKILPSISSQAAFILESFRTIILLNEIKMSEERERVRSLILSSISHDLKTPLSSIIESLSVHNELMRKNEISVADQQALIFAALSEAKRLNKFISEILEMTKIRSGFFVLKKQFLSARVLIEEVVQRLKSKLKDYELEIVLTEAIKINFDPVSFDQIIQNLMDNITKYSTRNSKITISEKLDEEGYKIFIQDEGGQIDPEKIDLIFNKFERLNQEKQVLGNGLGLSIAKALMEVNNSSICAKNVTNKKGIIFTLMFNDFQSENCDFSI